MYITKAVLNKIRNIDHLEISFSKPAGWHVLIGDNGAGKSTILRAIALAIIGPYESSALRLGLHSFLRMGFDEGSVELMVKRHADHDRYATNSAPLKRPFNAGIKIKRVGSNGRSTAKIETLREYKHAKNYIWSSKEGWFATSFGPFRRFTGGNKEWDKVYYANPRAGAHLSIFGEDVALTESLEWLRELNYKRLEQNDEATFILNNLRNFINKGELLPHGSKIEDVSSEGVYLLDGNGQQIEITEMSDGFRSILSLTFELLRQMILTYGAKKVFKGFESDDFTISMPGVVIIDEIDAHLHPTWQARIGQWFTRCFPEIQFIVTTHSPIICRAADRGSVWRLAAPGSNAQAEQVTGTALKRLIYGNILDAYSTEMFGEGTTSSPDTTRMLEELARLNKKSIIGEISDEERARREELLSILPTESVSS
ncbi:MAG: AAA family ATPase [bacterium]|nr:AAA family ATPase [bacterium]